MTHATETDLGPLTWVKGEIDAALQRAADAVAAAAGAEDAGTHLQFAQTHLHQVRGALSIIGLDGLTQFAEAAEQFLGQMSRGECRIDAVRLALAARAVASLGNYLEEIAHGAPDQALRLAPLYEDIAAARGQPLPCAADLFHPDLSRRPPRREQPPPALTAAAAQAAQRHARARFERGLLEWLRGDAPKGARVMRDAIATIEALQATPAQRSLWWAALAFYDGLIAGSQPVDTALKRLCAQIDAQFRRLLGGTPTTSDRLLRDILYRVATMPAHTAQQQAVRACWQLDALLPADGAAVSDIPLGPLLQNLQPLLEGVRAQWDGFCSGTAVALATFDEKLGALVHAARPLGRPATQRLLGGLQRMAQWLRRDPLQHSDALALEVATALLLLETDFAQRIADAGLAAQMDLRLARLEALLRGETPAAEAYPAHIGNAGGNQEKQALAQLCHEMRSSLAQVEQTLDDYFRNQAKHEPLAQLRQPLQQIVGALDLLGETRALELVREAGAHITRLIDAPAEADKATFETLAHQLSALGFYLEALPLGSARLDDLLHPERRRTPAVEDEAAAADMPAAVPPRPVPPVPTPLPAAAITPVEPGIPAAIDAPLPDGSSLPDTAAREPSQAGGSDAPLDIEALEALDELELLAPAAAAPAPAAVMPPPPLPGSDAEIDAELLCIFIEEATEVLATISEQLELARSTPQPLEHLTTIRRGFHTLKGSGRMVGLGALGETAWGMEQALNRWLQLDWPLTPAVLHLIDAAHQVFAAWIETLRAGSGDAPDARALLAEAERLRSSETAIVEPVDIEAPAAATAASRHGSIADADSWPEFPALDLSEDGEIMPLPAAVDAVAEDAASAAPGFSLEATSLEPMGGFPGADPTEETSEALPEQDTVPLEAPIAAAPPGTEARSAAAGTEEAPAAPPIADSVRIGDIDISTALFSLYQAEALQHIDTLEQEIAHLVRHPGSPPADSALRAAHTLAGISGTARLQPPHELARALEHALGRLRDQGRTAADDDLVLLRSSIDTLRAMQAEITGYMLPARAEALLAALEACGYPRTVPAAPAAAAAAEPAGDTPAARSAPTENLTPPPQDELDPQLLPIFLEEAGELFGSLHAALRAWQAAPDARQHPATVARLLHSLKGSARMAGAMTLGSHLHELESRLEDSVADKADPQALADDLILGLDIAEQMIDGIAGLESGTAEQPAADAPPVPGSPAAIAPAATAGEAEPIASATLRVRAEQVDRFVNQAGEIGIARTRIEGELRTLRRSLLDLTENVIRLRNQLREIEIQADVQMQSRIAQAESHHGEFDPLEMDRYTRLQELTRMMAESVNDVTTVQQNLLHNLDGADIALNGQARTTRELQQGLMGVRMLPFDSLADRLYRVVRQSAKELGKRAALDLRGGRIEIDRSVLEQMAAPLEHLLRNAVAHGIEPPQERSAAGKPETGQIVLSTVQEGNEIAIELSDDGRGLDFARIAERARTSGLIGADEHPDARRLTKLIFLSGFSTAGQLSEVSGRGVGMDVVKSQTAAVGGRIDVSSETGRGTSVRIHLPLTLAVTQALLVKACGRSWAIPSSLVAQATELKLDALREVQARRGTDWQGEHYPYRYLPRLLGDREARPEEQRYNWLLLLRAGTQTLALHVDGLRGNQEIVVKNAGPQLARIVGMAGATVLADGEIALILNPVALASRSPDSTDDEDTPGMPAEAPPMPVRQPTVMVVDDSLTVRRVTGRLLEREGYRVITAKDGVDALEQLADILPDVVLSDIEMPRMDGFDLVRNIRADERTRALPVIMITSRLADKHRRYAEEIGANHYLGKPYQEEELLALLAGYTGKQADSA